MKPHQEKFRLDIRKRLFTEGGGRSLEQGPQGSGHSTKPVTVQATSGQWS